MLQLKRVFLLNYNDNDSRWNLYCQMEEQTMIEKMLWNSDWKFCEKEYSVEAMTSTDGRYQSITLPHDWLIHDVKQLYRDSIGWYQKDFFYHEDGSEWIIRFEGVYMDSTIFLNGIEIGSWKYGYSTFELELTPYLVEGENQLRVRVVHRAPNSRWYSGAGIYRNVYLIKRNKTHIPSYGVYITPIQKGETWEVEIDTEVRMGEVPIDSVVNTVYDRGGAVIGRSVMQIEYKGKCDEVIMLHDLIQVRNPELWDIEQGNLYCLTTELMYGETVVDYENNRFGFRTIRVDSEKGFFINGRHVKIKGSCEHHGFGCLGTVTNKAAIRRKLEILRSMGVNAIRTAHNMPSVEFMELADEMGFLVDSESFDMWGRQKTTYDYGRFFEKCAKEDVASWIRRDRNHPSVIMWSVGNEIYDMHEGEIGVEELKMLLNEVKKHDWKKHALTTFASNYLKWENAQKCGEFVDVVGYNYSEYLYKEHHKKHPDWVIYGSETASMLASRGVYHFPLEKSILCNDNQQCSALGNCCAGWGAHHYTDNIIADRDAKYSLGQFIWSGFDYFGEPTPYHTRNSYFGQIDTAGFPKDSYFIYQAEWTNVNEHPMVHVFPYWDFNDGQPIDVCVCSNASNVELFLNGRSLGKREIDHVNGTDLVPHWKIPYEVGELEAVAYDEEGNVIATDIQRTPKEVDTIRLSVDKKVIGGNHDELFFVEVTAEDERETLVCNANNRVHFEVTGAGRLVGLDNGDSTDYDEVKGTSKRLFRGRLLAVIAPIAGQYGEIYVKATSEGMKDSVLTLQVIEGGDAYSLEENREVLNTDSEIPIRKVELSCEDGYRLSKDQSTVKVTYRILPETATYQELHWKIVNDTGIEIGIATLTLDKDAVYVTALGDGEFFLRCEAYNGGILPCVQSDLHFSVSGMGPAFLNPYDKISAGLCVNRPEGISEGEEHGVRFLGRENTSIYFESVDFGTCGSEEVELSIFKYYKENIRFRMYLGGTPRILICEGEFTQSANWMEFKKETYPLYQKVTGIHTVCIESEDNFQLKTIAFHKNLRGFERIEASEYSEIFGDEFHIMEHSVKEIGNNVSVRYTNLNFGNECASKLRICGKSLIEKNSIHIIIKGEQREQTQLLEVNRSEETCEFEFPILEVQGDIMVTFMFLPGSKFDFEWFQFVK